MNSRIKAIRQAVKINGKSPSQEAFGLRLGVSRDVIANMERANNPVMPSGQLIKLICIEFDVSETWLRTGEGEMFNPKTPDEELAAFMGSVLREDIRTSVRKRLIDVMRRIPPEMWKGIADILEQQAAEYRQNLPPNDEEG